MCTVILKRQEGQKARGLDCDQRGDQDGPWGSMMVLSPPYPGAQGTQGLLEGSASGANTVKGRRVWLLALGHTAPRDNHVPGSTGNSLIPLNGTPVIWPSTSSYLTANPQTHLQVSRIDLV